MALFSKELSGAAAARQVCLVRCLVDINLLQFAICKRAIHKCRVQDREQPAAAARQVCLVRCLVDINLLQFAICKRAIHKCRVQDREQPAAAVYKASERLMAV